jgi:protein HIRA/HIR1
VVSAEELARLKAELYGDPSLRLAAPSGRGGGGGVALAAAPEVAALEARARAEAARGERLQGRLGDGAAAGMAAPPRPALRPVQPQAAPAAEPSAAVGGRAAVGTTARGGPAGSTGRDPDAPPPPKRVTLAPTGAAAAPQASAGPAASSWAAGAGAGAGPGPGAGAAAAAVPPPSRAAAGGWLLPPEPTEDRLVAIFAGEPSASDGMRVSAGASGIAWGLLGTLLSMPPAHAGQPHGQPALPHSFFLLSFILRRPADEGPERSDPRFERPQTPMELQAANVTLRSGRQSAELLCMAGAAPHWHDSVADGHVVAMAGCARLVAVGTTSGDLLVGTCCTHALCLVEFALLCCLVPLRLAHALRPAWLRRLRRARRAVHPLPARATTGSSAGLCSLSTPAAPAPALALATCRCTAPRVGGCCRHCAWARPCAGWSWRPRRPHRSTTSRTRPRPLRCWTACTPPTRPAPAPRCSRR